MFRHFVKIYLQSYTSDSWKVLKDLSEFLFKYYPPPPQKKKKGGGIFVCATWPSHSTLERRHVPDVVSMFCQFKKKEEKSCVWCQCIWMIVCLKSDQRQRMCATQMGMNSSFPVQFVCEKTMSVNFFFKCKVSLYDSVHQLVYNYRCIALCCKSGQVCIYLL